MDTNLLICVISCTRYVKMKPIIYTYLPWPLGGQNFIVSIFASWMSKYRFFGSRISKIALVLDYGLWQATYWPPNDLWDVKLLSINICFKYVRDRLFWSKISKIAFVLDYDLLEAKYWLQMTCDVKYKCIF